MKNLPISPPKWLRGHPTALRSWRQFMLRRAEGPVNLATQRRMDLLANYCDLIDHVVAGTSPGMEQVAKRMNALTARGAADHFKTSQEFRAAFRSTLDAARAANSNQARAARLAQALGVELEAPAYDTPAEFRDLVDAVLPVGRFVLAGKSKPVSSRTIQITYSADAERIRKNVR